MEAFPAIEVLTPGPHGLPVGHRLPLTLRFTLGRASPPADLAVRSNLVSRVHCEVFFEFERWWVRDLGSSNGVFVRGERVHDTELTHLDCFMLPGGVVFRLLLREPEDVREPAMEAALREAPDDPRRWSVYADWQLEHGTALGARMSAPDPEDDLRWLGALAGEPARGDLQVEWYRGLPSRVVLRALSGPPNTWLWEERLAALVRDPNFRFVRALTLDLGSFHRTPPEPSWAARLLTVLGPALPLLETLSAGPGAPGESALVTDAKARARSTHPRLGDVVLWRASAREAALTVDAAPADVRVAAPQVRFTRTVRVGPTPDCELQLTAALPVPAFLLTLRNERWVLELLPLRSPPLPVRVNGVSCTQASLLDGDVMEPVPGLRLRLSA